MIKDKDKGFKKIKKEIAKQAKKPFVKIGIQGSDATAQKKNAPQGLTVVEIGTFHEFGYGVPRRSFLRDTLNMNRNKYKEIALMLEQEIMLKRSMNSQKALSTIGTEIVADCKKRIIDGIPPELSQETIDKKKSSTPLIDTGQLFASITYVVEG